MTLLRRRSVGERVVLFGLAAVLAGLALLFLGGSR
jgi:hypothetical protein